MYNIYYIAICSTADASYVRNTIWRNSTTDIFRTRKSHSYNVIRFNLMYIVCYYLLGMGRNIPEEMIFLYMRDIRLKYMYIGTFFFLGPRCNIIFNVEHVTQFVRSTQI